MTRFRIWPFMTFVALVVAAPVSQLCAAEADYFLKIEGLAGESIESAKGAGHKDWINLVSYSWGAAERSRASDRLRTAGPINGWPRGTGPGTLTIRKRVDASSRALRGASASHRVFPHAILDVRSSAGGPYRSIEMENVHITSYRTGGGAIPMESVSLNYSRVKYARKAKPVRR